MDQSEENYSKLEARLALLERKVGWSAQEGEDNGKDIAIRLRELEKKLQDKDNELNDPLNEYLPEEFVEFAKKGKISFKNFDL